MVYHLFLICMICMICMICDSSGCGWELYDLLEAHVFWLDLPYKADPAHPLTAAGEELHNL